MYRVRTGLFYLGMWLATAVIVAFVPLIMPLRPHLRYRYLRLWGVFVVWWLRVTCKIHYRVEGRANIPKGPAVVLAKHQSTWETIAFQQIFPTQTWVLKRELLRVPFFGWGLAATWPVAIDRKAGKEALRQVVEQGRERLASGIWMVVFPEGTRVAPGTKGRYQAGGVLLAKGAGVPIVPVAHNAGEHWPKDGFAKYPGTISVVIGPVIETEGKTTQVIMEATETWIEGTMGRISGQKA